MEQILSLLLFPFKPCSHTRKLLAELTATIVVVARQFLTRMLRTIEWSLQRGFSSRSTRTCRENMAEKRPCKALSSAKTACMWLAHRHIPYIEQSQQNWNINISCNHSLTSLVVTFWNVKTIFFETQSTVNSNIIS